MAGRVKIPDESGLLLGRPQFCLRTLMLTVTLCGALFALMAALGGLWSVMLALFVSLVVAHVFGNSLGTRLRDAACRETSPVESHTEPYDAARPPVPAAQRLRERTGISRKMIVVAALGAVLGATAGGLMLTATLGDRASLSALGLGTVSAAVLGGFFAFLLSSFCCVFSRALREALGDPTAPALMRTPLRTADARRG